MARRTNGTAGWNLGPLKEIIPENKEKQWSGVDNSSGPNNPFCITDIKHEILRPKPRRISCNSRLNTTSHLETVESNEVKQSTSKNAVCSTSSPSINNLSNASSSDRMYSQLTKNEHFSHHYITNNAKPVIFTDNNILWNKVNVLKHDSENVKYKTEFASDEGLNKLKNDSSGNLCISISHNSHNETKRDILSECTEDNSVSSTTHHHNAQESKYQDGIPYSSSSDENRSSGHASMSDTGGSFPKVLTQPLTRDANQKSMRSRINAQHTRSRYRATPAKVQTPWTGKGGIEDIKLAFQQLTIDSHTSTSTYSSASVGSESSEPTTHRLVRYSSLETINTNITNADEFVWVDSHNRLVELQQLPWTNHCILKVLQYGRCREYILRISIETIPRISYLLQRALVRVARETQRLSSVLGICTKHDIFSAFQIILCPPLADSCIKAALRAAAMLAMSGESTLKQSKSTRAGLHLNVGRFSRWMTDVKLGRFIHEYAGVYLCAGIENLLEEILLQCLSANVNVLLTATQLEHCIANNSDFWGLLQPYAHLNAGRVASGALSLPIWASKCSINSKQTFEKNPDILEPSLLTTCVGSITELQGLINRMDIRIPLNSGAVRALFYFMRCSQLEHIEQGCNGIQELCYERAYVVLPPLVEWIRAATAHGEHRFATVLDQDDILQTARLLLPGVDCPVRMLGSDNFKIETNMKIDNCMDISRRIQNEMAFQLLLTGQPELIQQALSLLPASTQLETLNQQGHTALMLATLNNDLTIVKALLNAGAAVNTETPASGTAKYTAVNGETQYWTALTYAAANGYTRCAKILLEHGANIEGGAEISEDKSTLTPLQVSCGGSNNEMVSLLLAHGAHQFLSTQTNDTLCYSAAAQRGCYSAVSVAAAHGQKAILQKLIAQPIVSLKKEVLSLEEMLEEGTVNTQSTSSNSTLNFNKTQIKCLQEAMYHSAENGHLDITILIRSLGVPWTLHCWMQSLGAAHEARLDSVIDQLLQDFLQVCPDDYSSQFVQECLPLLFNIFKYSKKEGTTLLLADIFSTCFGWEPINPIKDFILPTVTSSRIDPKYVNNPELSDVTFRVEGKLFYAHKIVLVTASPRLRAMLTSKLCEGGHPTVQINDIRYHIFQIVMQYLYQGGCQTLEPAPDDILELMAAANFFQLDGLLRYCESRCTSMLALDNVVSMYIHAKVYNAINLLEYCQGFLLQNMVALLTYDDSVKRLFFAKNLPKHDVLAGLLNILQNRIKNRQSTRNPKIVQKLYSSK